MIDATFVSKIDELAKAGVRTSVLPLPLEKPGTYGIVGPNGAFSVAHSGPAWHSEKMKTPADLAQFIGEEHARDKETSGDGSIYLSESAATFIYDQSDRRDRADCELVTTDPFDVLSNFAASPSDLSHEALVRCLRITFRGCIPPEILKTLRSVKFSTGADAAATIQNTKTESMGNKINNAVAGDVPMPEELFFRVPIFENHDFMADVACALEVFPSRQAFRISPYPGEIAKAMALALDDVAAVFDKDGPPVFRGTVA